MHAMILSGCRRVRPAVAVLALCSASVVGESAADEISAQKGYLHAEFLFPDNARPAPSCHASTIVEVETPNGGSKGVHLAAAWFGGTDEGMIDVGIWLAFRDPDAAGWGKARQVADGVQHDKKRYPCWNPVLYQEPGGPLLLFYKVGPSPSRWWGMLMTSVDGGKTWSEPRRLPEDILGPVKNKPVRLENGALLCPSSSEHDGWRIHMEITKDLGKTWSHSGPLHDGKTIGAIQPSILMFPGGKLQAMGRTRQGRVFSVLSPDQGRTWGEVALTDLPNPNSGTDAVTLKAPDDRHLLVYNPVTKGRTPLHAAVSRDGVKWSLAWVLENQPGEYSYPAVIQTSDRRIHVTYTWKRQLIKHVVLDPKAIAE